MAIESKVPSPYEWIQNHSYISLVTFKKSGQRVATPVWFASAGGKLYVYSELNVGKVKRIRNNASVEIAPCTLRGKVSGPTVAATATVLSDDMGTYVHDLLDRKYGLKKRLFDLGAQVPIRLKLRKPSPEAYIEISLQS